MSIETKICCRCGVEKPISRFAIRKDRNNRRRGTCLDCFAKASHLYAFKNNGKGALQHKEYHNRPEIKKKRYRQAAIRRKERFKTDAEYRKRVYSRRIKRRRERRKASVVYNLRIKMSKLIHKVLHSKKGHRSWQLLVGYNAEDLKKHLESKFSGGMTWDNYGKWHIDHIIPQSEFNFNGPEDPKFKACWSLENLQPLWAMDNIQKSNKTNELYFACPHCGQTYSASDEMADQSLECHKCHKAMRIPRPPRRCFAAPSPPD